MSENIVINGTKYPGVSALKMVNENGKEVAFYPDAVRYNHQTLSEEEKTQARSNIGAASVENVTRLSKEIGGLKGYEPNDGDMPKVFLTGDEFSNMTKDKNEVNMELDYRSKTKQFHAYILIKFQGNLSLSYAKKNFTIKMFSDEAREIKQKMAFRDWGAEKNKYVLKANYIDHTHARNIVCANLWTEVVGRRSDYDLLPEELRTSPKNGAVDGFPIKLYVNGTYQGVYTWNIGKDDWMWGMDEDNPNHALLCAEDNTDGVYGENACNFRKIWNGVDGSQYSIEVGTNSTALQTSLNNLIAFVINNNGSAFKIGIGAYLDVQSAIDYYIFQYIVCGLDGLAKNMLLGTYDGTKWYCGAYDMDSTFGLWYTGEKFVSTDYKCPEDYQEKFSLLWERLEENYWSEIQTRYAELRKTVYSPSNMFTHFERLTDIIGNDLYAEDLEINPDIPSGDTNNIKQVRNFIRDRLSYCDSQITNGIPATSVTFDQTTLALDTEPVTIAATILPNNTSDEILWLTSDSSVATVSKGVVTPISVGKCVIRAKCGSGYAVCTVEVSHGDGPAYTNLVPTSEERILEGDKTNMPAFTYDGVGYGNGARLSSSGFIKPADTSIVTGFITVKGGDVICIGGIQWGIKSSATNYVCAYKSDYSYIGSVYGSDGNIYGTKIHETCNIDYDTPLTTIKLTNNSDIAFIRVNCDNTAYQEGMNLIVTVNEEIA